MTPGPWTYPPELRDALAGFGLAPTGRTPPALVREALGDLYRLQLRHLRDRLLAGATPKAEYAGQVIALRRRYWMLSLPPDAWDQLCRADGARP